MKTICTGTYAIAVTILTMLPLYAGEVGFARLMIADPIGGEMQVSLWYPTDTQAERIKLGPYAFHAARDAEPQGGQFGLVVISHGTEGSDLGHRNLAISLAQAGIVVAAPLHPRDDFRDNSGVGGRVVMEGRPRQLSAVVDALLTHPLWAKRVDAARIGAFGFSLGGYTVLAALGMQPDIMRIMDHCGGPSGDPFCEVVGGYDNERRRQVVQTYPAPMDELGDARICAASLADPVAVPFSDAALGGTTARYVQVWMLENENVLMASAHGGRVAQVMDARLKDSGTTEITDEGAQHYSFLAPFPWRLKWTLARVLTTDAAGFDRDAFREAFAEKVTSFFVHSLMACQVDRSK